MFLNSKTGIQLAQSIILANNSEKEKTHKNRNLDHHTHNHTDTALDTSFLCASFPLHTDVRKEEVKGRIFVDSEQPPNRGGNASQKLVRLKWEELYLIDIENTCDDVGL